MNTIKRLSENMIKLHEEIMLYKDFQMQRKKHWGQEDSAEDVQDVEYIISTAYNTECNIFSSSSSSSSASIVSVLYGSMKKETYGIKTIVFVPSIL
jgi:hypothetical protein